MKHLLIVILAFVSFNTYGQTSFGIKAGYVNSWVKSSESRHGVSAGAILNIKLSETFSFQTEALYTMKGNKVQVSRTIYSYHADCIEVPVMVKAQIGNKVSPYLSIGASPYFIIKDNYNTYKPFDFAFIASAGLDFGRDNNTVPFIEVRYANGLSSVHTPRFSRAEQSMASIYAFVGLKF